HFGQGTIPVLLDDVGCTGSESDITGQCRHSGVGNHDCTHAEDVGVDCLANRDCTPGEFEDSYGCSPCPEGTYQNMSLQHECNSCPNGTSTQQEGSTDSSDCKPVCEPGQQYNGSSCVQCPQGWWNSGNKTQRFEHCAPCPVDHLTLGEGATHPDNCTLLNCTAGKYLNASDVEVCRPCPIGTYQDMSSQYSCTQCPLGTSTHSEGSSHFTECQREQYDGSSCVPCPRHTWNSGNETQRFEQCVPCPVNHVTSGTGATSSDNCVYSFSAPGVETTASMEPKYALVTVCTTESEKSVRTTLRARIVDMRSDMATLCLDVTCTNAEVTASCNGSGSRSVSAVVSLSDLPTTLTSPANGTTMTAQDLLLAAATAGTFDLTDIGAALDKNDVLVTTHHSCKDGYRKSGDACVLIECPPGRYINVTTKSCTPCPVNTYQETARQYNCTQCPEGTVTEGDGSTRSSDCQGVETTASMELKYALVKVCTVENENSVRTTLRTRIVDMRSDWPTLCPDVTCTNAEVTASCSGPNSRSVVAVVSLKDLPKRRRNTYSDADHKLNGSPEEDHSYSALGQHSTTGGNIMDMEVLRGGSLSLNNPEDGETSDTVSEYDYIGEPLDDFGEYIEPVSPHTNSPPTSPFFEAPPVPHQLHEKHAFHHPSHPRFPPSTDDRVVATAPVMEDEGSGSGQHRLRSGAAYQRAAVPESRSKGNDVYLSPVPPRATGQGFSGIPTRFGVETESPYQRTVIPDFPSSDVTQVPMTSVRPNIHGATTAHSPMPQNTSSKSTQPGHPWISKGREGALPILAPLHVGSRSDAFTHGRRFESPSSVPVPSTSKGQRNEPHGPRSPSSEMSPVQAGHTGVSNLHNDVTVPPIPLTSSRANFERTSAPQAMRPQPPPARPKPKINSSFVPGHGLRKDTMTSGPASDVRAQDRRDVDVLYRHRAPAERPSHNTSSETEPNRLLNYPVPSPDY
ncbi:hypothetical protein BaRGS_00015812, partial [Batillaria attramentaria]